VCTEDEVEISIGTGALLGTFAYICRQRPIIHCIDEGGGAELWQLGSTGVNAAKTQLELLNSNRM